MFNATFGLKEYPALAVPSTVPDWCTAVESFRFLSKTAAAAILNRKASGV